MKFQINPVYKKELKLNVRTMRMALTILFYNAILAFIGLVCFYLVFSSGRYYGSIDYSNILVIYLIISIIEIGLVMFVVPAFTASAIAGERERQTLEILLTTRLKPMQIIMGKLLSSISNVLLLVFSSMPILSIVFTVGGVNFRDLLQLVFMTLILAIYIGSMGIFFSTLFKKTVPATVFTYGGVIFLTLGTIFIVVVSYLICDNINQQNYMNAVSYTSTDIGNATLILLLNPAITMVSMVAQQYGSASILTSFISSFGRCNRFIMEHWFWCSVVAQMLVSMIFLFSAARLLNPLKRKNMVRKEKKKEMK